jgi:hypothetical protein
MTFEEYQYRLRQHWQVLREAVDARDRNATLLAFRALVAFVRKFGPDATRGHDDMDPDLVDDYGALLLDITRRFGKIATWH